MFGGLLDELSIVLWFGRVVAEILGAAFEDNDDLVFVLWVLAKCQLRDAMIQARYYTSTTWE